MSALAYMVFTSENIILIGAVLLIAGVLFGKFSYRMGLPLLLVFLLVGMGFGVDGLGVQFSDMHTAQFIGMVALCVILFSGGLDTKYSSIRPVLAQGLVLSTLGVLLTALLTGIFVWWLSGMPWTNIHFALLPSLLLAATMASTDSASVFGILGSQKVGLKENLRPTLELESGSNDPMAYMLTLILIETIQLGGKLTVGVLLVQLVQQFAIGGLAGFAIGKFSEWLIKTYKRLGGEHDTEDEGQASSMVAILALGSAFLAFALADIFNGNGYLAVYICGIVLGNSAAPFKRGMSRFMSGISWLCQIIVFLMLGLLVNPHEMLGVAAVSLLIGVFMIILGRPLSVFLCLLPFRKMTFKAKCFVSWVGLRGAVPIIFATYPVVAGVEGASQIFNIVFFVTLLSLIIQGTTVISASRKLGLTENPPIDEEEFGVEIAESSPTALHTMLLTESDLTKGNTLRDMSLPKGTLVMMIRRGDQHIIPNGTLTLLPGDVLLLISEKEKEAPKAPQIDIWQ